MRLSIRADLAGVSSSCLLRRRCCVFVSVPACRPSNIAQNALYMVNLRFASIFAGPGTGITVPEGGQLVCGVTLDRRRAACTGWRKAGDDFVNFWCVPSRSASAERASFAL